jgi:hypothetical protein
MMAKKKKEEFEAALMSGPSPFVPGIVPTTRTRIDWEAALELLMLFELGLAASAESKARADLAEQEREAWAKDYADHHMTPWRAFYEYTGFPEIVAGGIGLSLLYNIVAQPTQVASKTSIFSAARFGFTRAVMLEVTVGTLIFAAVLTVIDPQHKVQGWGLDETKIYQKFENEESPSHFDWKVTSLGSVV